MPKGNRSGLGFTSYSVDADEVFGEALRKARREMADLRPAFAEIARDFYKTQKAIFNLGGPGQYPDLSEKPFTAWWEDDKKLKKFYAKGYKEYKEAKFGFAYPILKATGALEKAVTRKDGPGNITVIGRQSLLMGHRDSAIPYGKFHQSDKARSGRLPLRKYLFIGPESGKGPLKGRVQRWTKILETWTLKKNEKAGVGDSK